MLNSDVRVVPISWLKPHEQTIPTNLDLVHQQVVDAGAYTKPILVDRVTGTILDGHHRHAVGRRLGLTRLPALLIDYQSDPTIQLDVWPACGRTELTKQEVIDMALSPSVFPPKTSRHSFDGLDRENDLPEIDISAARAEWQGIHMGQVPGIGASVWDAARAAGSAPAAGFLSFETPLRGWNPSQTPWIGAHSLRFWLLWGRRGRQPHAPGAALSLSGAGREAVLVVDI